MEASDHQVQNTDRDDLAGHGGSAAAELAEQARRIAGLTAAIEEVRRGAIEKERGAELGYRFDAYPKWLEASGWKDQSRKHRAAWPALRRLLELERWPGAATRLTYSQLADHLCVSEDTAKRRLRDLAGELDAIEFRSGTGRSPSVVVVKHPIETPLKYEEVPWEAGGLAGAPAGYLENLRGAKRHYAELYGTELPAESAASGEEATEPEPPKESEPEPGEEPPTEKAALIPASPEGAGCAPLETRESCSRKISSPSDTQEGEENPTRGWREKGSKGEKASKEIEREIKAQTPNSIGNEGRFAALALADATGRYDELARARLAQAAQYLISCGEVAVLQAVTTRIARAQRNGGTEIRDPLAYVVRVIQDVRNTDKLTPEERDLAAGIALLDDADGPRASEEEKRRRREEEVRKRRRDYEWFFDHYPERRPLARPAEDEAPDPEPWEGSPFAGVVPPELWLQPATSRIAGAIRRRIEDIAAAGDAEEYRRAREELYAAPWVGEPFKERVIARCDELMRDENSGGRTPTVGDHG